MPPRRFLPPISQLHAFEAAARTQSFTQAAQELALTQSAVSRQIRALEEILGVPLFRREKQKVYLTVAGHSYAREVRDALNRIANATLGFRANPEGGSLHLAVLPFFATRWLIPRLPGFLDDNPTVRVHLTTRMAPFDFRSDPVDAAIHFGLPDWHGARLDPLMPETLIPVCSEAFAHKRMLRDPSDLIDAPLLHIVSRPDAWEQWFASQEVDPGEVHGMLFDHFAHAVEASRAGMGVALVPFFLIGPELESGALVMPVAAPFRSLGRYYFAWPETHEDHPPLAAFRSWVMREAASDQAPSAPPCDKA